MFLNRPHTQFRADLGFNWGENTRVQHLGLGQNTTLQTNWPPPPPPVTTPPAPPHPEKLFPPGALVNSYPPHS